MGGLLSRAKSMMRRGAAPLCAAGFALALAASAAFAGGRTVSRVLIAGGEQPNVIYAVNSVEVWDSSAKSFSALNPMQQTRAYHTASLLTVGANAGNLLFAGGVDDVNNTVANAEVYSPATGSMGLFPLIVARAHHTATVLGDGRVLITGGTGSGGTVLQSAEIYDPTTAAFSLVTCAGGTSSNCMSAPRTGHTATLLGNGTVLIAGGATAANDTGITASAEIFDPSSNTFTALSSAMSDGREFDAAIMLNNGAVLIAGGITPVFPYGTVTADVFNPTTSTFTQVNSSLSTARVGLSAAMLGNGEAMMEGGTGSTAVDLFSDSTSTFSVSGGSLNTTHRYGTATALKGGAVLITGGGNNLAELANSRGTRFTLTGAMSIAREGHTATLLP